MKRFFKKLRRKVMPYCFKHWRWYDKVHKRLGLKTGGRLCFTCFDEYWEEESRYVVGQEQTLF